MKRNGGSRIGRRVAEAGQGLTIVLITGANRGLGFEVNRRLGEMGHTVLLGCRSEAWGREAEESLRAVGINAPALVIDLAVPASHGAAFGWIEDRFKRLDALINNAAIHYDIWQRVTQVDWNIVSEAMEVNVVGAWRLSVALLPLLRRSAHPRIVNVSSEAGLLAGISGGTPAYSLSKAGLNAVTCMLARELQKERFLINAVCPGWVATEMGGIGGRPVAEGVKGVVWAATLADEGPNGGFFRDGRPLRW